MVGGSNVHKFLKLHEDTTHIPIHSLMELSNNGSGSEENEIFFIDWAIATNQYLPRVFGFIPMLDQYAWYQ